MSAAANPSDTSAAAPAIPHGDESFRSLIESAPQALYVVNGELRVVAFNTRAAPIFATVEPVLGTDIAELATRTWGVELASRVMERFRDTFETGESYVAPTLTEARYPVGRVESWDWQLRRVLLPDGTFGVACYFQDLTPIREAEAAVEHARARADTDLRQRSAQFEILLDKAPLGVYLVDADLRIRQVNPAALPAFRQIPELVGRSFEEVMQLLWSKSDADDIVRVFRKTLATGGSYVTSQSVERASEPGVLEYFDWRIDRIPLPDGRFGVVCYFRDVSESKRAEAALKASEDSLLENEARLELALDAANMGTFVWYPEEDRTESDARMLSLFGLLPSEKLNLAEALGKLLHVEDRKKYGAAVERAMDPRGSGTLREDIRVVHPDGSTRWVAVTAQMLFTGSPRRATRLVGTVADVDARKQIEQALRDSEERLRDTDRRKDEFLAMLAHELRNPLAPIRTGLELIRVAGNTPESIERVRTMMDRQVGHMVRLIDDLLDVSRITSGKIRLQRRPTLLTTIVNTAVEANRTALADARVDLRIELPEAPVLLDVDPTRFVQIVSNLLHNAVKFTNAAGRIEISARIDPPSEKEAGCLRLNVSDSGVGISSEMLPRVF
ncbi:MAG TPA: PAS domain S-box protein, partial [Polyangiaceae bacterium]|nr:PAS domain S-box protein [Polyangiaceae bacterium]